MTARRNVPRRIPGLAVAGVAAVVVLGVTVAVAPTASADPGAVASRGSEGVTADTLPTAQIDGVVWSQAVRGDVVYAGGSFTSARPAGAAPGVSTVPRGNLMSYSISTGALGSFGPTLNGQVKTVTVSPDGSRLYVGGDFTTVNGQSRYRIAAFDTNSGALVSAFAPGVDTTVNSIVATNSVVYVGGAFSNANGVPRSRLAAFSAATGALLGWAPTADNNDVQAMVLTPDGSKLVVGGSFTALNGSASAYGMGAVNASTGALMPWAAASTVKNGGVRAAILSLSTDGTTIYGTGYVYGSGGNLEGTFAADPKDGAIKWIEDCFGDTYDNFPMNGIVYTVSHAHDCTRVGGFPGTTNPATFKFALGFTSQATGTLATNQVAGYPNFGGQPSPSMVNWFPELAEGSYTGQSQAAWSVSGNGKYLVLGGEFPTANGKSQQGLVRLAVPGTAPSKSGPVDSGYFFQTTQSALSPTSVNVRWTANWDRDDQNLKYELIRNGDDDHPVYAVTAASQFWNRPTLSFTDNSVQAGTTYNYYVRATDPDGNSVRGDYTTVTTPKATAALSYSGRVVADGATDYWRLGSDLPADTVGSSPLTLSSGVNGGVSGAIKGDADTAATFTGTTSGSASTRAAIAGPQTYTIEVWFKTYSTSGGKIVGFGNRRTGLSTTYDRHLYVDSSGLVHFGTYNGKTQTLVTANSYNDGAWHHAVATQSAAGSSLYLDGRLAADDASFTRAQTFDGYWRIGGDAVSNWPGGSGTFLRSTIDDVAIYPTALTAATVKAHYEASGR